MPHGWCWNVTNGGVSEWKCSHSVKVDLPNELNWIELPCLFAVLQILLLPPSFRKCVGPDFCKIGTFNIDHTRDTPFCNLKDLKSQLFVILIYIYTWITPQEYNNILVKQSHKGLKSANTQTSRRTSFEIHLMLPASK